jgi:hypothetical protein
MFGLQCNLNSLSNDDLSFDFVSYTMYVCQNGLASTRTSDPSASVRAVPAQGERHGDGVWMRFEVASGVRVWGVWRDGRPHPIITVVKI